MMPAARLCILLAAICMCLMVSDAAEEIVDNSAQLLAALQNNSVETIVLDKDIELGPEFDQYQGGSPLLINRNVTIKHNSSVAGRLNDTDVLPVIDLMHKNGIMQLCSNCLFRFVWVNIAHENSVGTGLGMSTFRGVTGSRLERIGGVGLRTACPATGPTLTILNNTRRSSVFPYNNGQQLASSTNYSFRGKLYPDMLIVADLSADIPLTLLTSSSFIGGYAIRRQNATRLCDHIVSAQCLMQKTPEECIALMLAGNSSRAEASAAGIDQRKAVAIAVPVAVGGSLLLFVAAFIVWRRHRPTRGFLRSDWSLRKGGTGATVCLSDVEAATEYRHSSVNPQQIASGPASTPASTPKLATNKGPWQVLWSGMAPQMVAAQNDAIEMGPLLGAGSFARVYKARWAGLDVAVKVINHYSSSAADVAGEVQLMLGLNHPHVVRAYHCITKQLVSEQQLEQQPSSLVSNNTASTVQLSNTGSREDQQAGTRVLLMTGSGPSVSSTASRAGTGQQPQPQPAAAAVAGCSVGSLVQDLDPAAPPRATPPGEPASAALGAHVGRPGSGHGCSSMAWPLISGNVPDSLLPTGTQSMEDGGSGGGGGKAGSKIGNQSTGEVAAYGVQCETWLVTEYCDRGTLARQAIELQPQDNEQDMVRLLQLLRDVACGLTLLHSYNIVHADLNAHNVLIASSPAAPGGLVAKIADLGLSRVLKQDATHRTTRTVGMLTHQPPELLKDGRTSPAVDIYSFGIMMYEVFTRQAAYKNMGVGQIFHQLLVLNARPPVPPNMPDDYELLMERCWSTEPDQRPSVDMLLECLDIMIHGRQQHESSMPGAQPVL